MFISILEMSSLLLRRQWRSAARGPQPSWLTTEAMARQSRNGKFQIQNSRTSFQKRFSEKHHIAMSY
jgi:hypothetical protein